MVDGTRGVPAQLADKCAPFRREERPGHAFRHHRGPVSAITTIKGAVITGSWDGTVCVAKLAHYRDWWADEGAAHALRAAAGANATERLRVAAERALPGNKRKARLQKQLGKQADALEEERGALDAARREAQQRAARNRARAAKFLFAGAEFAGRVTALCCARREGSLELTLFAGYTDGHVRQWDMRAGAVIKMFLRGARADAVTALAVGKGRLYSGYTTGGIKIWETAPRKGERAPSKGASKTQRNLVDVEGHTDGAPPPRAPHETCPLSTGGRTRRVRLVQGEGRDVSS